MFHSQEGQDKLLETFFFRGFKNGVFMDVGAYDGKTINNTLFFEETHGWTGVNVEPIKKVYDQLVQNRPGCINLNVACSDKDGKASFICNDGYTTMISGLKDNYDPRHLNRLNYELQIHGGTTETIEVDTMRIETICDTYNINHINYLSIDVEGSEMAVIQGINFDKLFIDIIGFENNFQNTSDPIIKYLYTKGYVTLKFPNNECNVDIFMVNRHSKFINQ
jgi:FkbM family methyltransferase